jgi:hypothetical protein
MTSESVEQGTPVLDPGSRSMSPASVGNHSTGTEVDSEPSTYQQLPKQIGQYPTDSDVITDLEGDTMSLPPSRGPIPIPSFKQVPKNSNQQFAFRNPNLKHEFHPSINGKWPLRLGNSSMPVGCLHGCTIYTMGYYDWFQVRKAHCR